MTQIFWSTCLAAAVSVGLGVAWAQSADEVLEPGAQALPPVEGATPQSAPTPPGTPPPSEPPETAGPSGALGAGPDNETNGLIAILRTDTPLDGAVRVVLSGDGDVVEIDLNDAGKPPDVTAGDGLWAGLAESAPLSATVSVELADGARDAGSVSWKPEEKPRELKLSVVGSTVEARATSHSGAAPGTQATAASGATGQPAAVAPTGTQGDAAPAGGAVTPGPEEQRVFAPPVIGGPDWMSGLAIVVALGSMGVVLLRKPSTAPPSEPVTAAPAGLPGLPARVPEAGILGSGTPSLSDGVSVWTGPDALVGPLLGTLARSRPVVVAAPADRSLPPTSGGPVFRAESLQPHAIDTAVRAVLANGGLSVCVVALPGTEINDALVTSLQRSLPEGVGAILFASASSASRPAVELGPAAGGVSVVVGGRPLRQVQVGPGGFDLS